MVFVLLEHNLAFPDQYTYLLSSLEDTYDTEVINVLWLQKKIEHGSWNSFQKLNVSQLSHVFIWS